MRALLIDDVARLRRTCPWYQGLTLETLRIYLSEEIQEVLQAQDSHDINSLKEELGDLLFQILLYAQIASESNWFSTQDVIDELHRKIIRRNPHVFGTGDRALILKDIEAVNLNWQTIKACEKEGNNKGKNQKMYDVTIQQNNALVAIKGHPAVTVPLDLPPAQKVASSYTRLAWVWVALATALETAEIRISDIDMKEIATLIAQQKQV